MVRASRVKRSTEFYDPLFEPKSPALCEDKAWPESSCAITHALLTSEGICSLVEPSGKLVVNRSQFDRCDFEGDFTELVPAFKGCEFFRCDFGYSKWRRARFKGCKFSRCSLSLASFENCEFRDCVFSEIGLSGNELVLDGTTITNPAEFISSGYTNTDQDTLRVRGISIDYQLMRLEGTKATVARQVMHNLSTLGDEGAYYESVKAYHQTSLSYRLSSMRYRLSQKPAINVAMLMLFELFVCHVERLVIECSGKINNWGASIGRPTITGFTIFCFFTLFYWLVGIRHGAISAMITSLEITLLIGYTKHALLNDSLPVQSAFLANMVAGVIWYSVMIPTIINRISRVR